LTSAFLFLPHAHAAAAAAFVMIVHAKLLDVRIF